MIINFLNEQVVQLIIQYPSELKYMINLICSSVPNSNAANENVVK